MSLIIDPSLFYNPLEPCRGKDSYLPLLDQQGKLQFVTFRCIDSIPLKLQTELKQLKQDFERNHSKPWTIETLKGYRELIGKREEELLDAGCGKCYLKIPGIRKFVDDALCHFNGRRYDLHSYVIMPNHVHVLLTMLDNHFIATTLESLKRFTGMMINKATGENGKFWDGQNYCRMIRNQDHYDAVRNYINKNPRGLKRGEFSLRNFK